MRNKNSDKISYAEIDEAGTKYAVKLIDISKEGLQFQVPVGPDQKNPLKNQKEVMLRIYFTKDDYLPVTLFLRHHKEYIDERGEAYFRYGCEFNQSLPSFEAVKSFIEFIYKFAEYSCIDKGESQVYFL